jgi:hypothetical protein
MPMQPESLEILEKADVPPAQAGAIIRVIEIEIAGAKKDTLATSESVMRLPLQKGTRFLLSRTAHEGRHPRNRSAGVGSERGLRDTCIFQIAPDA